MEENKLSIVEKVILLIVMMFLLLPLGIICYISYADIMIIYTGIVESFTTEKPIYTVIFGLIFCLGVGCIVIPVSFLGIGAWLISVYYIITQKDFTLDDAEGGNTGSTLNRCINRVNIPELSNLYHGTIHILTREQQLRADEQINKGEDYQSKLNSLMRKINDHDLQIQLYHMQFMSDNMLKYLKSNPEKVTLARQFIDYYLAEVINFINYYIELENSNLNTPEIITAKNNIKETIKKFEEAYQQQFSKLVEDKVININVELVIARKMLKEMGISHPTEV